MPKPRFFTPEELRWIKATISVRDMVNDFADVDEDNRAVCHFCKPNHRSMLVTSTSFVCFACHREGDLIAFTKEAFSMSFYDTVHCLHEVATNIERARSAALMCDDVDLSGHG